MTLITITLTLSLFHQSNKEHIPFLDLNVKLSVNKLSTDLYIINRQASASSLYVFTPRAYEEICCLQPSSETELNFLRRKSF